MFDKVLKIVLLLSPLAYGVNIALEKFDIVFFHLAVACLFIAGLLDKPKREIKDKYLIGSLLGIGLISVFWSSFNPIVLGCFLNLLLGILALYLIVIYCDKPSQIYKYMVWAGAINIIVFVFQRIGFNPILNLNFTKGEEGGMMGNAPRLVGYLAVTLPFALSYCWWLLILYAVVAIILKEFTLLLIVGVILYYKANHYYRQIIVVALMMIGAGILYKPILNSLRFRFNLWMPLIETYFKRPLLGYGLGMYPHIANQFSTFTKFKIDFASNSYLQFIFGVGILGVVWIGFAIKEFWKKFDRSIEALGVLSILILAIFEYPIEIHRLWLTIIAIIGFWMINREEVKNLCG